jgi:lipopolysaccharide export system protein LptC
MSLRANPAATLFPLLLAGLLAGMSFWLEMASRAPATVSDGKSRHDPDYIITQLELRRFDLQGKLQHTVIAEQLRHYPDDDSTVVLTPRITYHRDPPTFINAREAQISSKGEHVTLIDDVRVARSGVGNKPDTVLTTTRLDAWPDDEIAKSNVPVTITQGQTNVHGSGLSADNKASLYILEGPVQGVFFRAAKAQPVTATSTTNKPVAKPASKPKPEAKPKAKPKTKSKSRSNR